VWLDTNGNGVQDASEKGIAHIKVELYQVEESILAGKTLIAETETDANGYYLFAGLEPGTYRVRVIMPNSPLQDGYTQKFTTGTASTDNASLFSTVNADGWSADIVADGIDEDVEDGLRFEYLFADAGIVLTKIPKTPVWPGGSILLGVKTGDASTRLVISMVALLLTACVAIAVASRRDREEQHLH